MNNLKYAPMWENDNVYYHFHDKEAAGGRPLLRWVVMDKDYFIGKWQLKDHFAIGVFDNEEEARHAVLSCVTA